VRRILSTSARLTIVGVAISAALLSTLSPQGPAGLLSLPYAVMGAILVLRRPRTTIGWLLIGVGLCFSLLGAPVSGTPQEYAGGSVELPVALWAVIHNGLGTTGFFFFAVLVMVFPSGRLAAGRWGRIARAGLVVAGVFTAAVYVVPEITAGYPVSAWVSNPFAILPDLVIWRLVNGVTAIFPVLIVVIAGAASLVVRARRAVGTERQQLRWIATSFAVLMIAVVGGIVLNALVPAARAGLAWLPAIVALPTVPVAIGIAVLRYRLYEIDRIISRTIGWAIVTGMLLAVYGGAVIGLQALLSDVTQGETLAVAASTLVAFALFQPLRRRVQSAVNRRFDRARVDAERTATAFAERLRDQIDLGGLQADIAGTVETALRPTSTGVWIRGASR